MLETIKATNELGQTATVSLLDQNGGFLVKNVDGLDPVDAILASSSFALLDGETEQSVRRGARDIIMTFGLLDGYTSFSIKELRDQLYNFFMTKRKVVLTFTEDGEDYLIGGTVEKCAPNRFSKDPEVVITVRCEKPDFLNPEPVVLNGVTVNTNVTIPIWYAGTSPTGVDLTVNIDRSLTDITLYVTDGGGTTQSFLVSSQFQAGDVLEISTSQGEKQVVLVRSNTRTSLLYAVSPYAQWVQLKPGQNQIRVYALGNPMNWHMEYLERYGAL